MNMTYEQAAQKYGDNQIMTVPAGIVHHILERPIDSVDAVILFNAHLKPAYRRDAEFDTDNLQPIPYVVVCGLNQKDKSDRNFYIYTTHRIGGDNRLIGKYSIGTGGHVECDESIGDALERELKEEIGLTPDMFTDFSGNIAHFTHPATTEYSLIYDSSSEVNSVHVGIALACIAVDMDQVHVTEPDKLCGEWMSVDSIYTELDANDLLEDWSRIVLHRLFKSPEDRQ